MTELSRSLIAAAREGLAPDPEVAARVRAKVAAAVAAGVAGTVTSTSSHAATATSASTAPAVTAPSVAAGASSVAVNAATAGSVSFAVKLGVALVVLGAGAFGVASLAREAERGPDVPAIGIAPSLVEEAPAVERFAAPDEPFEPRSTDEAAPAVTPAPSTAPAAIGGASDRESTSRRTSGATRELAPSAEPTSAEPVSTPEPASLSREVELIDLAMVSLRKNAPRAAIEAIRVFERETLGKGQMAEEAAAIEIEARCMLREDVTAALARFDRKWPESAQRDRLHTACFARR